jgi:aminomethyltransferase
MSPTLRRTPLYDRHLAAGARIVAFAGWEMPVQYPAGLRAEHLAVRERCGIFDVSHMGEIETRGPRALELLQRLLCNDVAAIPFGAEDAVAGPPGGDVGPGVGVGVGIGGAQYSLLCREDGGVLDDLFTYRVGEDRYITVTNAANHERDLDRFLVHCPVSGAEVIDRREQLAMLAVQGPDARGLVAQLTEGPLPPRLMASEMTLAGARALVCGTGYTGEDGVEVLCDPGDAPALWDAMLTLGAQPAGLGARDTLRLEACFHLYGNDLSTDRNPIEAGLGWCCKEQTGFIGAEAVAAMRASGPPQKLVAFAIEGGGIARRGNEIVGGGVVSSGTLSPCLGIGVGLAYVPAASAEPGTRLAIDVRGKMRDAVVRRKPLYSKGAQNG